MQVLTQLRAFQPDQLSSIEEMVLLVGTAELVLAGYSSRGIEPPEWLPAAKEGLDREITNRTREANLRALKELEAAEEALKSSQEKRADLAARKKRLQQALGMGTPVPVTGQTTSGG